MAEGEGRDDREDLFEDLDKFFAPIQDVDWPETETPEGAPAEGEPEPSEPEVVEIAEVEEEVRVPEPEVPEEPSDQEALFASAPDEAAPPEGEIRDVEAFLFAGQEEEAEAEGEAIDVGEAIATEREARPPAAYVDLPTGEEEEPSPEDVEAAAEHFAASVRGETTEPSGAGEPEGSETHDIEPEPTVEELLGPEPGEPSAGAGEPSAAAEEPAVPVRTVRVGTEGLGGPSWQEPTTVEVGPEPERRGPGRNMQLAVLTGLVLAVLALIAIFISVALFAVLAGAIVLIGQGEFYFALQKRHQQPATALGLVTGVLVLAAGYFSGEAAMLAVATLGLFATFLWFMTVPEAHRRNVVSNVGLTMLGVVWMPLFAAYSFTILTVENGRELVLTFIGLTIAYDASAFAVGYFWGSRPLAATVSPRKSWEGAIGATLVVIALAVGIVAPTVTLLDTIARAVGAAVIVAVFAPLGDLAESLVKRDLGIKDMGSILPGHGGVLDRIDAMLFVAPAAVMYLRLLLL